MWLSTLMYIVNTHDVRSLGIGDQTSVDPLWEIVWLKDSKHSEKFFLSFSWYIFTCFNLCGSIWKLSAFSAVIQKKYDISHHLELVE